MPGSFSAKATRQTSLPSGTLISTFDKSIHQVTDWLLAEKEMLRKQPVTIGDIDAILVAIEKQKVSVGGICLFTAQLRHWNFRRSILN